MRDSVQGGSWIKILLGSFLGNIFLVTSAFASSEATAALTTQAPTTFSIATGILVSLVMFLVITLVATEKVHRTLVVFFIASSLIFLTYTFGYFFPELQLLTMERAFASIDGQVIGLLVAMMMLVGVMAQTNVFQWIAVKIFEVSRGNFLWLYVAFFFVTAIFSAFLDNVTMIFLITPICISIAKIFGVNPVKFVVAMIIASNLGGTATLIGDPPNIMIGSYAGLSFNQFLVDLGIPVFFMLIVTVIISYMMLRKDFAAAKEIKNFDKKLKELKEENKIKHKKLLIASLITLALVVIFFFLHGFFHMPAAVPALMGAALLMLIRDRLIRRKFGRCKDCKDLMEERMHKTFSNDVEWLVIGFFVFLFMIVGAIEHTGILDLVAVAIQNTFGDNLLMCALAILWISAIFSMLLDNIPFTAVMLPVVGALIQGYTTQGVDAEFLWWALAFGACLGGNGTLIAASANLVGAALLEKEKYHLSFMEFFKIGFPLALIQVSMASVAIYIMYIFTVTA